MKVNRHEPVRSRVHVAGHPIHPMIIPFPIAFIVGAAVTDIVYAANGDSMWANFSFWLLWAAVATGLLAAVVGLADFIGIQRIRNYTWAWVHFLGNAAVLVFTIINAAMRLPDPAITDATLVTGVTLSVLATGILLVTGWAGGELIYRHRIAVIPDAGTAEEVREEPPRDIRRAA